MMAMTMNPLKMKMKPNSKQIKKVMNFARRKSTAGGSHKDDSSSNNHVPQVEKVLIVCGVDGTVYSLEAENGQLVGLFQSGGALVSSSSVSHVEQQEDTADSSRHDGRGRTENNKDTDDVLEQAMPVADEHQGTPSPIGIHLNYDDDDDNNSGDSVKDGAQYFNENHGPSQQQQNKRRVVPGLDGVLYTLVSDNTNQPNQNHDDDADDAHKNALKLAPLPVSVFDAVESPITTCGAGENDDHAHPCGMVMGEKHTQIFALDPSTGAVQWMQHGGNARMGFTASSSFLHNSERRRNDQNGNRRGAKSSDNVLMLQRENYIVREVDLDTGEENWNVTVGKFHALDFGQSEEEEEEDEISVATKTTAAGGIKLPVNSARTASNPHHDRRRRGKHQFGTDYGEQFVEEDEKENFPSVVFGEDGTSIIALDSKTNRILWRRRTDTVIASVFGVAHKARRSRRRSRYEWIELNVLDLDDDELYKYNPNLSLQDPRSAMKTSYLLDQSPFSDDSNSAIALYASTKDANQNEAMSVSTDVKLPRLGMHSSTLFVTANRNLKQCPKAGGLGGVEFVHGDAMCPSPQAAMQHNFDYSAAIVAPFDSHSSHINTLDGDGPFYDQAADSTITTHRTDHGLFLSWQAIAGVMAILVFGIIKGRMTYLSQKRHWEGELTRLEQSNDNSTSKKQQAISRSEHAIRDVKSSAGNILNNSNGAFMMNVPSRQSLRRVMSLPHLAADRLLKLSSPRSSLRKNFESNDSNNNEINSSPRTNTPGITRTATGTTNSSMETKQEVGLIDGIPLVQYSRYDLEFEEIRPIGEGGFGSVFQCKNKLDGREYATKKIRIESFVDAYGVATKRLSKKLKRVLREVKVLALLDHPNIVRYYTAWLELDRSEGTRTNNENSNGSYTSYANYSTTSAAGFDASKATTSYATRSRLTNGGGAGYSSYLMGGLRNRTRNGGLGGDPFGWSFGGRFSGTFSVDEEDEHGGKSGATNEASDIGFIWERSTDENEDDEQDKDGQDSGGGSSRSKPHDLAPSERVSLQSFDQDSRDIGGIRPLLDPTSIGEESSPGYFHRSTSLMSCDEEEDDENDTCDGEMPSEQAKTAGHCRGRPESSAAALEENEGAEFRRQKHILYIQMQHCTHTLHEFLASPEKRKGPYLDSSSHSLGTCASSIDIPYALQLFSQIVKGVKHVHQQGLIHRDLKPSNCFLDGSSSVKIGDFGLSRESVKGVIDDTPSSENLVAFDQPSVKKIERSTSGDVGNTAGVGTYLYASPEQISGRDYDASTDIFSLGVMLFELCFPMYTAMERAVTLKKLHNSEFPDAWQSTVAASFPTLHSLLTSMLSVQPSKRPSAATIEDNIDKILGGYTVFSLDRGGANEKGSIYLRVEADEVEGILRETTELINATSPFVMIQQYSLKGQSRKAIMEFALSLPPGGEGVELLSDVCNRLRENDHIDIVRRVTGGTREGSFDASS
uniref:non-specific serine/threonine protein kinase n=1 Tax=Leptocylindrus danicus TaxID=163516 RepID=A0A7S2LBQ7_9STRA|mmetsp:Transcript_34090/g.49447  ORF Transcript_34090/g.49447 Transcript_34090/m.49447 type:complete len:1465 (+) Transcript_34090:1024-5418(+)